VISFIIKGVRAERQNPKSCHFIQTQHPTHDLSRVKPQPRFPPFAVTQSLPAIPPQVGGSS
jgi:hypothetical protein